MINKILFFLLLICSLQAEVISSNMFRCVNPNVLYPPLLLPPIPPLPKIKQKEIKTKGGASDLMHHKKSVISNYMNREMNFPVRTIN